MKDRQERLVRGFTLIEMVVTIGIIIIAVGFMAPTLSEMFKNRKLEAAGTLISGVLNEARNDAVTSKTPHRVVFLRRGVFVYKEAKQRPGLQRQEEELGSFKEGIRPYTQSGEEMAVHLRFAKREFDEIPQRLAEEGEVTEEDIFLRFRSDGTIDFGELDDISTGEFILDPPRDADIIIEQANNPYDRGYIDIRAQGGAVFKIGERLEDE